MSRVTRSFAVFLLVASLTSSALASPRDIRNGGVTGSIGLASSSLPSQNPDDYDIERYGQALSDAQSQLEALQQSLEQANSDVTEAQKRLEQETAKLSQQLHTLAQLQSSIDQNTIRIQELERLSQSLQAQIEALNAQQPQLAQALEQVAIALQAAQSELGSLEQQRSEAQTRIEALRADQKRAKDAIDDLELRVTGLRQALVAAQKLIPSVNAAFEQAEIALKRARASGADSETLQRLQDQLNDAKQAREEAELAVNDASSQLDADLMALRTLQNASQKIDVSLAPLIAAQTARDQGIATQKKNVERLESDQNQAKKSLDEVRGAVTSKSKEIQSLALKINQMRQQIEASQTQIAQLQAPLQQQRAAIEQSKNALERNKQSRDQLSGNLEALSKTVLQARQRFEQVERNVQTASQVARHEGAQDGSQDGSIEGARVGAERGRIEGDARGTSDGQIAGTNAGISREQARGTQEGSALGFTEGTREGSLQGRVRAQEDGPKNGKVQGGTDGYKAAYQLAYAAAYPRGKTAGTQVGAYQAGHKEGYALGLERATREGQAVGSSEGTKKADDEFYSIELKQVNLPNDGAPGLSRNFSSPDWERSQNFNPRRRYPHPRIDLAYFDAYRRSFVDGASSTFDRVYADVFNDIARRAYNSAYTDFARREYPLERKAAFDLARAQAFQQAYDRNYIETYRAVYQPLYDAAYLAEYPLGQAKGQPDGDREGFNVGKSDSIIAETARGKSDGNAQGYADHYERIRAEARAASYARRVEYFSSNAVIQYAGAVLADSNSDDVVAPGENVSVTFAMKNFGKVSQSTEITAEIVSKSNGIDVTQGQTVLASLPGQSHTMVTGALKARVSSSANIGNRESLSVRLTQNSQVIGLTDLVFTTAYPYSVPQIRVASVAAPNVVIPVTVDVRNLSSKLSSKNVTVELISRDGLAQVRQSTAEIGRLRAGEARTANLSFSFDEDQAFKTLTFDLRVREENWVLGASSFTINSTKRWAHNASSLGLLVVTDNASARLSDELARLLGSSIDLWDTTIEGDLNPQALSNYRNRLLILSDLDSGLSSLSGQAIENHLRSGGKAYAVIDSRTRGTDASNRISRLASSLSKTEMQGMSVYQRLFRKGMLSVTNTKIAIDNQTVESGRTLALRLMIADLITKTLDEKMAAFAAAIASGNADRTALAREALLHDIRKEMEDNKDLDKDYFKNERQRTLLLSLVNSSLAKAGEVRKQFLRLYPDLNDIKGDVYSNIFHRARVQIEDILKPMKKAYESERAGR